MTSATTETADFLNDNTVAAVCCGVGEIIRGEVSVKAGLEAAFCGSRDPETPRLAVDDIDEVVVVVDVAIDVVGEIAGSLSIVVADVTAAVVAIDEGDDECVVFLM